MPPTTPLVDDDNPEVTVADLVIAALARKDMSMRDAAERTGGRVSHSQIARICRGETTTIQPQTLQALSDALRIPIRRLREANGWAPATGRPFVLPERADELSVAERRVIVNMIGALLAARDRQRK
jgi:transcriptional regulator with XRE-family HTH domain